MGKPIYSVIDENGVQIHTSETRANGEMAIAEEFGISWGNLAQHETKRRHSKAFSAFQSVEGLFREIVPSQRRY